jgi:hypothetical protein
LWLIRNDLIFNDVIIHPTLAFFVQYPLCRNGRS